MRRIPLLLLGLLAAAPMARADVGLSASAFGTAGRIATDPEAGLAVGFTAGLSLAGVASLPGAYSEVVGFWRWQLPALIEVGPPPKTLPLAFAAPPSIPNPFRQRTAIHLAIPAAAGEVAVRIDIYDVAGRRVRTLDRSARGPGMHVVEWDGTRDAGARAGDGIYFCRIQAGTFRTVQRLALVH